MGIFGEHIRFLPRHADDCLTPELVWQGALLGKARGGLTLSPRLRALMPETPPSEALRLDDVADILALLTGRSLDTGLSGRETGLYWQNLPLCRISLKQGRALCAVR